VGNIAVQGNLDPLALFLPEPELEARVARLLKRAKGAYGHIFNLGHGIIPQTDPDKVGFLVECSASSLRRAVTMTGTLGLNPVLSSWIQRPNAGQYPPPQSDVPGGRF